MANATAQEGGEIESAQVNRLQIFGVGHALVLLDDPASRLPCLARVRILKQLRDSNDLLRSIACEFVNMLFIQLDIDVIFIRQHPLRP